MKKLLLLFLLCAAVLVWSSLVLSQESDDSNEGSQAEWNAATGMWKFSWWGKSGRTYFPMTSENLIDWDFALVVLSGNNAVSSLDFTSISEKLFFKLTYSDEVSENPQESDFDNDGVSNLLEVIQNTNPLVSADADFDGMPDDWETFYGLNPRSAADAQLDDDHDGLTNAEEADIGTKPDEPDSDGDGVDDGEDGWALIPELAPKRLAVPQYVVIPLKENALAFYVNNNGQAIIKDASGATYYLNNGSALIPLPNEIQRVLDFNDQGHALITTEGSLKDIERIGTWGETAGTQLSDDPAASPQSLLSYFQSFDPNMNKIVSFDAWSYETSGEHYMFYAKGKLTNMGELVVKRLGTFEMEYTYIFEDQTIPNGTSGFSLDESLILNGSSISALNDDRLFVEDDGSDIYSTSGTFRYDLAVANNHLVSSGYYVEVVENDPPTRWGQCVVKGDGTVVKLFEDVPSVLHSKSNPVIMNDFSHVLLQYTLATGVEYRFWINTEAGLSNQNSGSELSYSEINIPSDLLSLIHYTSAGFPRGFNNQMTMLFKDQLWLNAKTYSITDLIHNTGSQYTNFDCNDLNDLGLIVGSATNNLTGKTDAVLLLPVDIIPNFDRNETIDLDGNLDRGKVTAEKPFRWWTNTDFDKPTNEAGGGDFHVEGHAGRNSVIVGVDGSRDLVDFFPLYFDIKHMLEVLPTDTHTYKLSQADSALNFVYTNLRANQADDFLIEDLQEYGVNYDQEAKSAHTLNITAAGVELDIGFLNKIKDEDQKGVLLFEGRSVTEEPLVLEVYKGNDKIAEYEFPIKISPIEDMYRRVNLRNVNPSVGLDGSGGFDTDTAEPENYPADLSSDKWFVFVHGFNVDDDAGQGWNAEVYKRMHQLGSRAKFVAVQWHGDTGGGTTYHLAVNNAFHTSQHLAGALNFASGDVTIAAHSLGNVVVGNAIAHEGLNVSRYYLVNAATPMEAYDSSESHDGPATPGGNRIVHDDWKDYWTTTHDQRRVYSSYWHQLFNPASDNRAAIKWGDRFSGVNSIAYNFYSSGEDVVEDALNSETVGSNISIIIGNMITDILGNRGAGTHAWVAQEIVKGRFSPAVYITQGGWGFAEGTALGYVGTLGPGGQGLIPMPADQTDSTSVTDEEIAQFGLFYGFEDSDIHGPIDDANALAGVTRTQAQASALVNQGTASGKAHLYELLATGIPSRSYAAAANEVAALNPPGQPSRNFDMASSSMRDGWPSGIDSADGGMRWRHSDFKDISLRYVYPMYDKMIEIGELKQ